MTAGGYHPEHRTALTCDRGFHVMIGGVVMSTSTARCLDGVLVGGGGTLVLGLVELVGDGTGGTGDTVGDGVVAGNLW